MPNFLPLIGSVTSSLADVIGNAVQQRKQHKHEKSIQERSFAESKEMAEYQYSKDLEQWERANQYNAPIMQMQRFKDAGLNPHLIYGQGNPGNTATTLPKYQAPRPNYTYANPTAFNKLGDLMDIYSKYQNFRLQNAQIDLVKNQAELKDTESQYADRYYYGRAGQSMTKNARDRLTYHWESYEDPYAPGKTNRWTYLDTQLQAKEAQINNINSQITYRDKLNEWYVTKLFSQLGMGALRSVTPLGKMGMASKLGKKASTLSTPRRIKQVIPDYRYGSWRY